MWLPFHRLKRGHILFVGATGRALTLAQNFEYNCKWVFMTVAVSKKFAEGEFATFDDSIPYSQRLIQLMLGPAIRHFGTLGIIGERETKILEAARDARNYIAHECTVAVLGQWSDRNLEAHRRTFEERVRGLAEGDGLVSNWSYQIQEKEPSPGHWVSGYADAVTRWVLRGSRRPPTPRLIARSPTSQVEDLDLQREGPTAGRIKRGTPDGGN